LNPPAPADPPRRRRVPLAARIAWWLAWVGLAAGLAAAAAVWLAPVWGRRAVERAAARVERATGPLEPIWEHPEVAPEDNAVPRLLAAGRAVRLDEAERELIREAARAGDPQAIAERREELAALVERNREAVELLLATAGLGHDFGGDLLDAGDDPLPGAEPELLAVTQLAVVDARLALLAGDPGRAERVAGVLGELTARYAEGPNQIFQLFARGHQARQLRLLVHVARACREPACPERLRALLPPEGSRDAFRRTVAGEAELLLRRRAMFHTEVGRPVGLSNRLVHGWFDYSLAGTLDQWLKLLAGWDLEPRAMEAALAVEPGPIAKLDTFRVLFAPDWTLPGRLRTTAEARDLAALALGLHAEALRGTPCARAWPAAEAAWRFTELSPREVAFEAHDDGSCTLRRADAEFIAAELHLGRLPPAFEWPVPPPTPPIR
jgi:hypothetical protein